MIVERYIRVYKIEQNPYRKFWNKTLALCRKSQKSSNKQETTIKEVSLGFLGQEVETMLFISGKENPWFPQEWNMWQQLKRRKRENLCWPVVPTKSHRQWDPNFGEKNMGKEITRQLGSRKFQCPNHWHYFWEILSVIPMVRKQE